MIKPASKTSPLPTAGVSFCFGYLASYRIAAPLQVGQTCRQTDRERTTNAARRTSFFPSDAAPHKQLVRIQSNASNALTLFRFQHRTTSPTIAHAGDLFCQLSGRSPMPREEGESPSPRCTNMGVSTVNGNSFPVVFGIKEIFRERLC